MGSPTVLRSTRPGAPSPTIDVSATVTAAERHTAPAGDHTTDDTAADEFDRALEGQATEGGAAAPTTAVAEAAASVPATTRRSRLEEASDGTLMGDWCNSDVKFPTLRIVNGSGPLTKTWNQGTLLFGDEALFPAPDPRKPNEAPLLRFIPLTLRKRYRQNLTQEEQAAGEVPRIVDTVQEVESLGGTTLWRDGIKPSYQACATLLALLQLPEGSEHPGFANEIDGKLWATGLYYSVGTAYASSAKLIFNAVLSVLQLPVIGEDGQPKKDARGGVLKRPYLSKRIWTMRVVKRDFNRGQQTFTVFTPECRLTTEDTSQPVRDAIAELLSVVDIDRATSADVSE